MNQHRPQNKDNASSTIDLSTAYKNLEDTFDLFELFVP